MASDLIRAVDQVYIGSREKEMQHDECIDDKLSQQRSRKRTKRDPDALRRKIEDGFLSPPTSFGSGWLNSLQQYVAELTAMSNWLTLSTDDGISLQITPESTRWRPRNPGPSLDS